MAGDGERVEPWSLQKVPNEVGGETLAVRESLRDIHVVVRVGETRLGHDERRGEDAEHHKSEREDYEGPAHGPAPIRSVRCVLT